MGVVEVLEPGDLEVSHSEAPSTGMGWPSTVGLASAPDPNTTSQSVWSLASARPVRLRMRSRTFSSS